MNLALLTGLILTTNVFTMMAVDEPKTVSDEPQKKEQRVKVIVNQDGKEIKIDTTFNFADEKAIQAKVDSILKLHGIEDGKGNGKNIVIMKSGKHMTMHHSGGNMPGNEEFQVFIQEGDSGKVKGKKIVRIQKEGDLLLVDADGDMIPPPPPVPPVPPFHMKNFTFHSDPFAMDPNDDDIITYDRKDIGKGLEKIIIVRKKRDANAPVKVEGKKIEVEEIKK
jgi:hypothetical protein